MFHRSHRALIGALYEQRRLKIWNEFWEELDFESSVFEKKMQCKNAN